MKQINLTLAQAGDVAVLRNREKSIITRIDNESENGAKWFYLARFLLFCLNDGKALQGAPYDIIDITRNGVSIF